MPIDPSIALGVKVPDQTTQLSSMLGVVNGVQQNQINAQKLQSDGMTLNERMGVGKFLADPGNYTDKDGNIDWNSAVQGVMKVAPTTGTKYVQDLMTAQKQHTEATSALSKLDDDNRTRISNVLSTIKPDSPPDVVHGTLDALDAQYKGRLRPMMVLMHQGYDTAAQHGPQAVQQFLDSATRGVLPQETQQNIASGNLTGVQTNQGTQLVQTKVGAAQPVGPVGQPFAPPNQIVTTPTGRTGIANTASGQFHDIGAGSDQAPVNFPQGESKETWADLQAQRTAAQQAGNAAPQMHDINQTIVREANKGMNTGALGQLTQRLASATGYTIGSGTATDYNLLGKMLERSALTAAQSMGPHTNAGLEAAVRANGSLEYTPQAIKKIAYLNDALTSGAELYRDGLEKAVQGDPNGVFAKRKFDAQWSKVATPQVLRLKNAVDGGNKEEIGAILQEVGGRNSAGARKLHEQLTQMLQMVGQ